MHMVTVPPTNVDPGAAVVVLIAPERVKHSVPSTRRSSRTSMRILMVLPSLAPMANVTAFRIRVKSSPSASER